MSNRTALAASLLTLAAGAADAALNDEGLPIAPMTRAERLQRVFRMDLTTCPECGGRLHWIADVTEPSVIRLLHLSRAPPGSPPARGMPRNEYRATNGASTSVV